MLSVPCQSYGGHSRPLIVRGWSWYGPFPPSPVQASLLTCSFPALGPVVGAPISETLGRKWVYLTTMPLFILFTMGAGLAHNTGTLLACRFFSSLLGAPAVAVGAGSVADLLDL
jgi:MFS family permease